jgi:sugar lactone lactonase YvrE
MEFSSLSRLVRRLPIVSYLNLGVALVAGLLLLGCGSSGGIHSITATVGNLSNPRGLAVDSSRNLYIADSGDHVIREVATSTGLLTSVVGTLNSNGFSGDGSAATSAQLNFPQGIALDSAGNLYIADTGNNCIRKVTPGSNGISNGTISTIAGTAVPSVGCTPGYTGDGLAATSAQLKGPLAVALDSSGNLYIADTGNNVIRKLVLSTGVITTVAGTGVQCQISNTPTATTCGDGGPATSATFNSPAGIALDSSGNLYIADQADFVVREVSGGNITTVAGSYVAGGGCQTRITTCTNGGAATSALLNNPQAVAADSSGNLYIADTGNNVIRKVSGGTISTVVGNGTAGFSGDGGSATGAELNVPNGLTFDASGTLYIDDAGNKAVRRVSF